MNIFSLVIVVISLKVFRIVPDTFGRSVRVA